MKKVKKDDGRFTIRLNSKLPKQQIVKDYMNTLGRQVSSFITEAGYDYMVKYGIIDADALLQSGSPKYMHSVGAIPNMSESVFTHTETLDNLHSLGMTPIEDDTPTPTKKEPFDDEARQNILGSLKMFDC